MRTRLRTWWPILKAVLAIAILVAIGRQFAEDLGRPDLQKRPLHPGWLVVSALLYLLGLGFSALFWYRLLRQLGQRPTALAAVRAYYIGHLGKYLPGKAWALLLRATLARGSGVRMSVAAMTSFYEVLTTMAAGVLLSAILLALLAPDTVAGLDWRIIRRLLAMKAGDPAALDRKNLVLLSLLLFCGIGAPLLPPIFNRLVERIALPFREVNAPPLPPIRMRSLVEGLFLTAGGWFLLGGSLWAVFEAILHSPDLWDWETWGRFTAFMGLAYVAGFIIVVVPSGLGVREFMLMLFLVPALGSVDGATRPTVLWAVVVLRLTWTAAELILAAGLYWLPVSADELCGAPVLAVLPQALPAVRDRSRTLASGACQPPDVPHHQGIDTPQSPLRATDQGPPA